VVFPAPEPADVTDADAPVADDDGPNRRPRPGRLPAAAGQPLDAR
jgi:hypothetical protein